MLIVLVQAILGMLSVHVQAILRCDLLVLRDTAKLD